MVDTLALPEQGSFKVEPDGDSIDVLSKTYQVTKTIMLRIYKMLESLEIKELVDFDYNFTHSETNEEVVIKIACLKSNFCVFDAADVHRREIKSGDQQDVLNNSLPLQIKIEKIENYTTDYDSYRTEEMMLSSNDVEAGMKYFQESESLKRTHQKKQKKKLRHGSDDELVKNQKCHYCGKFYKNRKSLLNHVKYHLDDKTVDCQVCGFKAADKWKLKRHMNSHAVERKFQCELCGKSYRYSYNLTDHRKRCHPGGNSENASETAADRDEIETIRFRSKFRYVDGVKTYECEICGKNNFLERKKLMQHRREHRETCETNVMCHICSFSTKTRESLRSHINNVHKEKRLACDLCGTRYRNKTDLKAHMDAIHLLKRDYCCHVCGKSYSRLRTLQKHLNYHTAEKKIVCEVCGFKAVESGRMNRHMKSHTGIRNYSCDLCGKLFLYSYNVNLHKKLVHFGEKQKVPSERLTCHICLKKFQQIRKVREHLREFHGVLDDSTKD